MCADSKRRTRYENSFRNRPISGGRDLSCDGPERLPALYSAAPACGSRGTVHGRPVCFALSLGDLRVSGRRRSSAACQPLRASGGGALGAGTGQHSHLSRVDGPCRASDGSVCDDFMDRDFYPGATGILRTVPVALAAAGLSAEERNKDMTQKLTVVVTGATGRQGGA